MVFLQIFICFVSALINTVWTYQDAYHHSYLEIADTKFAYTFIVGFGTWFIIFMYFVPISMMVTLEMVKFI